MLLILDIKQNCVFNISHHKSTGEHDIIVKIIAECAPFLTHPSEFTYEHCAEAQEYYINKNIYEHIIT